MSKFLNARVDQIVESRWQPREGAGDPAAFEELVANVMVHGIKSPLKAFVNEGGAYELITGHRRRRAAIKAGLTHVPVIVVDTPKNEAALQALREEVLFDNLLHEPLTPLEEARAFKALQEEGYSIRLMAERLGKSKSYISERLSLLDKPEEVQELVSARADTLRHAREIAKVEDPEQRAALIEEARAGASYRDIKARVKGRTASERPVEDEDPVVRAAVDRYGARVAEIRHDENVSTAQTEDSPKPEEPAGEPALSRSPEPCPEHKRRGSEGAVEGEAEGRLIPVNGNGKTVYVSVPEPCPTLAGESTTRHVEYKHDNPAVGAPTAAGQHCPHCGDGRGRERCNVCGRNRWIIAFDNIEDYNRALALVGALIQK